MNDNDRDPCDVVSDALNPKWWDDTPWVMNHWHPSGAHFEHCTLPINLVVTDWTEDGKYDIGLYTDDQIANDMGDPIIFLHVHISSIGGWIRHLCYQGAAERTYQAHLDSMMPWPQRPPATERQPVAIIYGMDAHNDMTDDMGWDEGIEVVVAIDHDRSGLIDNVKTDDILFAGLDYGTVRRMCEQHGYVIINADQHFTFKPIDNGRGHHRWVKTTNPRRAT